jgi:DNA repair protein SbcD/Mre11
MITFFHTADAHFGVENYGKINAKTGIHSRLLDFKTCLEECINMAIEENIDFFVLAGDAYKTAYPTPTQQKLFAQLLFKLYQADIPVIIVIGNHDNPLSFGKANSLDVFASLPLKGFHIFAKPNSIVIETKNGPVQIVGIPWPTRNILIAHEDHRFKDPKEITTYLSEKVSQLIQAFAAQLDPKLPAVLVGHLTVSAGLFSGSEKCAIFGTDPIFLPSQLAIEPFDYVALGHLHRHQDLNKKGSPPIVYSGSIERVDFGERKEEKGFCRVNICIKDNQKKCSYEFVRVNARPMILFDIKLQAGKNQTEQILEELKKKNIEGAIVKIVYHLPEGRSDKVDLLAIQRACLQAKHLLGIIPIHKHSVREQRTDLKIDMDFKTLVSKYFDTKKELFDKKNFLIERSLELYEQVNNNSEKKD